MRKPTFKICADCPTPSKCRRAGKCAKKEAAKKKAGGKSYKK